MSMLRRIATFAVLGLGMSVVYASPAAAQSTRTWVSGVGDDINPCSRTAPCKTFSGAISKTAEGGEINCLDPAGFGAVTITKSMTISCPYTEGGALAGGNGITINDSTSATPGTAVVYLRGLDVFGVNPPTNGIRFISGAALHIEDTVIRRFNAASSRGISFQPSGPAVMYISNSTIADNGSGASGGGILIQPTGAAGSAKVVMKNVRITNNANVGIQVDTTGNTGVAGTSLAVDDSTVSGNATGISQISPAGTTGAIVMVTNSIVSHNSTVGLTTSGANAVMRVAHTTITGNGLGVSPTNSSAIQTYGNNRNVSNPTVGVANNGSFTGVPIGQQ